MLFSNNLLVPFGASLVVVVLAVMCPVPNQKGELDFDPTYHLLAHIAIAIVALIGVWIVFGVTS